MVTYPVHVPRKKYGGRKEKLKRKTIEYNRLVSDIESFINEKVEESDEDTIQIMSDSIAAHLGLSTGLVRKVVYTVDGGDNGVTVNKRKV